MKPILLSLLGVVVALGSGCGRGPSGQSITVAGSTAFQPFAEKLADQYMQSHPEATITVQGGGSSLGIQSALAGTAQVGMADLVTLPPEASGLTAMVAARDGIAVIVNPLNPLKDLSTGQIRDIFNGKIRNWKDAGGEDRPIRVVSRETGSGTRSSFEDIIGGISLLKESLVQDSNGTIRETVANDRDSIGYLSLGLLNDKVRAVKVDGGVCSDEAILAGRYKLVRPIYLLTQANASGVAADFVAYVLSSLGQDTIRRNGLLPAK
jgi:phosphate transport system substrate-binding protein